MLPRGVPVERHLDPVVHGTVTDVAEQLTAIVERTAADEVLAFSSTHDRAALRDSDAALATLKATLPLIGDPAKVGSQDAATWEKMAAFMPTAGLVATPVPANEAYVSLVG